MCIIVSRCLLTSFIIARPGTGHTARHPDCLGGTVWSNFQKTNNTGAETGAWPALQQNIITKGGIIFCRRFNLYLNCRTQSFKDTKNKLEYHELTSATHLCESWVVLCSWVSFDPISVLQSPMSLILQKTHNSLLAGTLICQNLNRNWPQMSKCKWSNKLKHTFLFSQDPNCEANKSLLCCAVSGSRPASVASGQEILTHHNVPITESTCRHVTGRWETARGHVPRVSVERFQSCQCPSLLARGPGCGSVLLCAAGALKVLSCQSPHSSWWPGSAQPFTRMAVIRTQIFLYTNTTLTIIYR